MSITASAVCILLGFFACSGVCIGQTSDATKQSATPTFRTRSNLVLVRVVVRDRDGRAIGNLQKEDFQLFDKGKPQVISRFSAEGTLGHPAEASPTARPAEKPTVAPAESLPPDRFVAFVFDDLHLKLSDLMFLRKAAEHHLSEALPAASRAAIYTISGQTTVEFTSDVAKLRDTIERIQPRSMAAPTGTECPDLSYYEADLIRSKNDQQALDDAADETVKCAHIMRKPAEAMARAEAARIVSMNEMETRQTLRALSKAVRHLAAMPGQRSIVLVSPGFLVLEGSLDEMEMIDRALRSNVTISALDARGLYVLGPGSDASKFLRQQPA